MLIHCAIAKVSFFIGWPSYVSFFLFNEKCFSNLSSIQCLKNQGCEHWSVYSIRRLIWAHNFGVLDKNRRVWQILLQIWQSINIRVGLSIGFGKISAYNSLPRLFQTFFFVVVFFRGGGGGCKKCWVRQRERASLTRFRLWSKEIFLAL